MSRRLAFFLPLALFAVAIAVFGAALWRGPAERTSPLIGRPAPTLNLEPLGAAPLPPAALAAREDGRLKLVNFFASWCPPCRVEHPYLETLAQTPGIEVIGVAYKDRPEDTAAFLAELGNPFARLGSDRDGRAAIEWGVSGVPESFVIDAEGKIALHVVGPLSERDVAAIQALTGATGATGAP